MIARVLIVMVIFSTALQAQEPIDPFGEIHSRLLEAVSELETSAIPLLASPQGGVAARLTECREASADSAAGVVFRLRTERKTTPAASASVASRNFVDDAATPPCGDARRGIAPHPLPPLSPSFQRLAFLHPFMAPIFREEGVPHEFLLVGLIESGYQTGAVSPREAVGMWQFIPSTARRFGLMDGSADYRKDFERSTRAAARYLRFLLDKFSDWRLALAAYNAGEDRVERAIELGRTRDFEKLSGMRLLPEETRTYVPLVLRAIAQARNLGVLQ